ncbi:MAG: TonB-dependent receptor [Bacteroidales bacterium]|nr:TonB-dependent receptor [Bacteroidales bacterium]MDT8373878.1 TonB-dependent receptor [Bacteroidales bacterium]
MKQTIMTLLFIAFTLGLNAQGLQIKGVVTSADDGQPVPGLSVFVKGTTTGTMTDINGYYSLDNVPVNSTIVFSFVGMKTREIVVTESATYDIVMASDMELIDEIVVVGYGTQKKSLVTGAIAKVDGDDLRKSADMRVTQALQGKTAGVVITANSGQPGSQISVRIRGAGTNGDAEPLYIIDGLPMSGAGTDFLNAADIESIEVLKDAASAAIYGARGANGVVLITTKTGRTDTRLTVSYDGYYGFQNPWKKIPMLNAKEYIMLTNEASINGGLGPKFTPSQIESFTADTDWQDEMFYYNAPKQNHSLSFMGGSDKLEYSSSINYFSQDGIVAKGKSNFEKIGYRLNAAGTFGFFKLGGNVNLVGITTRGIATNDRFGLGLNQALNMPPIVPVMFSDGSWATPEAYGIGLQEITNPVAMISYNNSKTRTYKLIGNLYGEFDFGEVARALEGLVFRTSFGGEYAIVNNDSYTPEYYLDAMHFSIIDRANKSIDIWSRWNFENVLTYTKSFGVNNLTLMAGTTAFKDMYENLWGSKNDLIFDDFEHSYLDNATDPESANAGGGYSEHTVASLFARVNYDLMDRYMLTATIRRDGSSRFGDENKYGYFPSASIGWVISREDFMSGLSNVIDMLKLRASWGQNGNESIGDFGYTSVIGNQNIYYFGDSKTQYNGTQPTRIANPSLRWETSEQTNFGIDLSTLNSSVTVTLDYYIKKTKDWLVTAPVPMLVGNSAPIINGGSVQNSGIEAEISYRKQLGDLYFSASVNGAFNKSEVLDIQNTGKTLAGGDGGFGQSGVIYAAIGTPMGVFHGVKTAGIFQTQEEVNSYVSSTGAKIQPNAQPGDIKFVDENRDGTISDADRVVIGSPFPDFTGGLNLNAEMYGFDFNMFLYAALGQEIYSATRRYDMNGANYSAEWLNRWTGEGTSDFYPRVTFVDNNLNSKTVSDFYIQDGSFVRLRNITLGYTLPKSITDAISLSKLRLYVSAENLYTFTKYTGYDPEIGGGVFDNGIDRGIYPQPRTIMTGISVTF